MRKLNMWKRLGIVLSVLWVVGVTGYFYVSTVNQGISNGKVWAETCEEIRKAMRQPPDFQACWTATNSNYWQGYNLMAKDAFWGALLTAVVPLPFLWLIVWGIVATARWVLRGRDATT